MPSRAPFLPPKQSPLFMTLVKAALPTMCSWFAGGVEITIPDEDLARLRSLKRQRLLLIPNHPTHFDPMCMMEVGKRVDEDLHFVAAREVFDWEAGLRGWLFQRCGVYSLIRGAVDRESFAMTQKILSEGKSWLVIFAEGEVSLENDTVLPLEAGVLSMALRVQDKLCTTDKNAQADVPKDPPLHVIPVVMRTLYKPGIEAAMTTALADLETAVGIEPQGGFKSYDALRSRIRNVGNALLAAVERTYLLPVKPTQSLDTRMSAIKDRLLTKMESLLDITPANDAPFLDRVRIIKNKMDRIIHAYSEDDPASPYEQRLLDIRRQTFAEFYRDLSRLINFLTLRGDYLDDASPERFAEVIIRLEQEIHGKPRLLHPRTTHIKLGETRDLRTFLPAFHTDKRATFTTLTEEIESEMKSLLHSLRN